MPKALVINPNTSDEMTNEIRATAKRVFQPPWSYEVECAPGGPESLESWTDYHLASVAVLPLVEKHKDVNGIVLACFGDPGLYLLKEYAQVPALGIAEASMSAALLLGARFGILVGMNRAVELMDSMVRTYGLEARYGGSQALDMRVLDFEKERPNTLRKLEVASQELRNRGAEVLLLGCAGLTNFVGELEAAVEMPVIDPVEAGCRMLISLCEASLETSRVGLYSRAAPQKMKNLKRIYSSEMISLLRNPRD